MKTESEPRRSLLLAEIFEPGMFNLGTPLEHMMVVIEPLRRWKDEELLGELHRMEAEGLVVAGEYGTWKSTFDGQVARERFVQSAGGRSECLVNQHRYEIQDLALAVIVAPQVSGNAHYFESDNTIRVYLYQQAGDCKKACALLVQQEYVRESELGHSSSSSYYPTSKGMRYYDEVVRARLGIRERASILDSFDDPADDDSAVEPIEVPGLTFIDADRFSEYTKLGEGAYGDVWRAWDTKLMRPVAVKFVRSTNWADLGAIEHARALARVQHSSIVTVHDVAQVTDPVSGRWVQAVVMELVEGPTLAEKLGHVLELEHAKRIGSAVLDAIRAYHDSGLAHTDLHERNVIVGELQVKVLDPLYFDTALMASTSTRQAQQAKDVRNARSILIQLIDLCPFSPDATSSFICNTVDVDINKLTSEFSSTINAMFLVASQTGPS
jgi:hypothetical protein